MIFYSPTTGKNNQLSKKNTMDSGPNEGERSGTLYVVATPIGNLEDLTFRALKILEGVKLIACEDTRQTRKLLTAYKLKKELLSYFQPKEKKKIPQIIKRLKEGDDVALVSDAGTPGISDPGYPLIRQAIDQGVSVVPIPGASALTAALSAAGLPTHRFLFLGFPPAKKEATKKLLLSLKDETGTLIFYLPPRKILYFLQLIEEILGERQVVYAREITKIFEEFSRGTPEELIYSLKKSSFKGEATVLIGPEKLKNSRKP
jgi:16S rRNA (cytidine1402-2'-O)-methyltransferase